MTYPVHDGQSATDLAEGLRRLNIETAQLGHALIPGGDPTARYKAAKRILNGDSDTPLSRVAALTAGLPLRVVIEGGRVRVEPTE